MAELTFLASSSRALLLFSHQTHPNVDKRLFNDRSILGLKEGKVFPVGQDVGVLKWRLQTTNESLLPLFSELCPWGPMPCLLLWIPY